MEGKISLPRQSFAVKGFVLFSQMKAAPRDGGRGKPEVRRGSFCCRKLLSPLSPSLAKMHRLICRKEGEEGGKVRWSASSSSSGFCIEKRRGGAN